MYKINLLVYFTILGLLIRTQNITLIMSFALFGIIILSLIPFYRKIRIQNIKNKNVVLNINKACWWEIEHLPGFQRVSAKKAVWIRNHNGKYISKEDFFNKNKIQDKENIKDLICI